MTHAAPHLRLIRPPEPEARPDLRALIASLRAERLAVVILDGDTWRDAAGCAILHYDLAEQVHRALAAGLAGVAELDVQSIGGGLVSERTHIIRKVQP